MPGQLQHVAIFLQAHSAIWNLTPSMSDGMMRYQVWLPECQPYCPTRCSSQQVFVTFVVEDRWPQVYTGMPKPSICSQILRFNCTWHGTLKVLCQHMCKKGCASNCLCRSGEALHDCTTPHANGGRSWSRWHHGMFTMGTRTVHVCGVQRTHHPVIPM